MLSLGILAITASFAAAMSFIIWRKFMWHQVNAIIGLCLFCLIFAILTAALYTVWTWFFFVHPAEIRKNLPIRGKELRAKRQRYFDKLPK